MTRQRDECGRLLGIDVRVILGEPEETLALLGRSTAFIERTHLTMRHFNSRLTRKSLAFSRELEMHKAAATWEDLNYNLRLPHKSLRVEMTDEPERWWQPRTPGMAAGLTDHIWAVKEL